MSKTLITRHRWYLIWLLLAALTVISQPSCNTEKRVTKKLMKLDQKSLNKVRPWPYNYTYHKYVQMLDNAKIRQEFYRKRKLQAKIAGDERTQKTMESNIKEYQKNIDRLESDRKYYKIYKLREREIEVKLKKEQKIQKNIVKQKTKVDKEALKRQKNTERQRKELIKERQERLDEKKDRLESKKKEYIIKNKANAQTLKQAKKEMSNLQDIIDESGASEDPGFIEAKQVLEIKINQLKIQIEDNEKHIESLTIELEQFIEEYYTPKDSVIESQMILSTDPIPQRTQKTIESLPDSIK